jgi:hypothetical protein
VSAPAVKAFDYRAFWALLLALATPGLAWTGIALHAAGHQGFTRATHAWMAAHWILALLFLVGAAGHIVLNGRVLLRHLRGLAARVLPFSRGEHGPLMKAGSGRANGAATGV